MSELLDICNEFLTKYMVLNFCVLGLCIHNNTPNNTIRESVRKGWDEYLEHFITRSYQTKISLSAALYTYFA